MNASPTKFSIELDETTVVAHFNQLIAFVHYTKGQEIKVEFFFANNCKAHRCEKDLDNVFTSNELSWNMVSALCTDNAPAMIECKSGLRGLINSDAPHIAFMHYMLH